MDGWTDTNSFLYKHHVILKSVKTLGRNDEQQFSCVGMFVRYYQNQPNSALVRHIKFYASIRKNNTTHYGSMVDVLNSDSSDGFKQGTAV